MMVTTVKPQSQSESAVHRAVAASSSPEPETAIVAVPAFARAARAEIALGGPIARQVEGVISHWLLRAPDDNPAILLMFVDREAQPARDLLPWSGEFAGKYLTGATQVLRLTRDERLRERLSLFVRQLIALQAEDGYLGPFAREHRLTGWAPNVSIQDGFNWDAWGHYHGMVGLMLWHDLTGDEDALAAAARIGDLLVEKFGSAERTVAEIGNAECNQAIAHGMALLHRRTGDQRHLALAQKVVDEFEAPDAGHYLNQALAGVEFFKLPNRGPRWESLHPIMALAELYWQSGSVDCRAAFEHLWWSIVKTDRHNNGGFSSGEQAQGSPYHRGAIETCCTIAWMTMSVEMLRLTGDARVADELELSTLNQVVALHAPGGDWCTYNTPMEGIRFPSREDVAFQIRPGSEGLNCCSTNAARGFGLLSEWALMADDEGLVLNWYGPGTYRCTFDGVAVVLTQTTAYPRASHVNVQVDVERPAQFTLKFRVPHWSKRTRVTVNGERIAAHPGTYAGIHRTWSPGDRIDIELDLSVRYWIGEAESEGQASVYRGPLLLALDTPGASPRYSRHWYVHGRVHVTPDRGASVEHRFTGDRIVWRGFRYDDAGQARVLIDGHVVDVVDQFGPGRDLPFEWARDDLGEGSHTVRIEVLGTHHPLSKGKWVNVERFEPGWQPPSITTDSIERAGGAVSSGADELLLPVETIDGLALRLREYRTAGPARTPYTTWLRLEGLPGSSGSFSRTNPSRTVMRES